MQSSSEYCQPSHESAFTGFWPVYWALPQRSAGVSLFSRIKTTVCSVARQMEEAQWGGHVCLIAQQSPDLFPPLINYNTEVERSQAKTINQGEEPADFLTLLISWCSVALCCRFFLCPSVFAEAKCHAVGLLILALWLPEINDWIELRKSRLLFPHAPKEQQKRS